MGYVVKPQDPKMDIPNSALADWFRCTLTGAFVFGLRAGMLEGVSQEDGQNAEKPDGRGGGGAENALVVLMEIVSTSREEFEIRG